MELIYHGETFNSGGVTEAQVSELLQKKQDKLRGSSGELVTFNESGKAVAKDRVEVVSDAIKGLSVASSWSPYGAGTYFPYINNTVTNKIELASIAFAITNRGNNVSTSDSNYTRYMARAISLDTSAPTSITNGAISLVYT